jgi:hypothetical protein
VSGWVARILAPILVFALVVGVASLVVATGLVPREEREVAPTPTTAPTLEIPLPAATDPASGGVPPEGASEADGSAGEADQAEAAAGATSTPGEIAPADTSGSDAPAD